MSAKNPLIISLNSRKQLLIAESALNRAGLVQEWRMLEDDVHAFASRAGIISSFALAAASLVAGLASFRRKQSSAAVDEKPSWLRTGFKNMGTLYTLWRAFLPQGHKEKE
jgi:hypothetical protein